jgi:hypothetical protein
LDCHLDQIRSHRSSRSMGNPLATGQKTSTASQGLADSCLKSPEVISYIEITINLVIHVQFPVIYPDGH